MQLAIIGVVLFLTLVGIVGGLVFWQIKRTDLNNVDSSNKNNIDKTQDFLPYEDIKDNVINLGMHQYRAVIKCSSINYHLKTEKEKEIIEMSYQRFLNSLTHPISILVQKKEIDNSNMLKSLKEDIENTLSDFPQLEQYANVYYNTMHTIHNDSESNKQTSKYIIVPFNDAVLLTNSSDFEKYEYSLKEITSRCQIIIDGLQSVGIKANMLNTKELVDLIYSAYHKDCASQSENILNGEFLSMLVDGEDRISQATDESKLDWILYEAQVRLETELANANNVKPSIQKKSIKLINDLNHLRESLAGNYKDKF